MIEKKGLEMLNHVDDLLEVGAHEVARQQVKRFITQLMDEMPCGVFVQSMQFENPRLVTVTSDDMQVDFPQVRKVSWVVKDDVWVLYDCEGNEVGCVTVRGAQVEEAGDGILIDGRSERYDD